MTKEFPFPDDIVLTHDHGGNGWAMVAWYPEDGYCHIAQAMADGISDRVFLAWIKKLNPSMRHIDYTKPELGMTQVKIGDLAMAKLKEIRADLQSGKKSIINTYIKETK